MNLPVALAPTLLLGGRGVGIGEASLAKIARQVLLWSSGAVREADVVTVGGFVGASHCDATSASSDDTNQGADDCS